MIHAQEIDDNERILGVEHGKLYFMPKFLCFLP